MSPLVRRIVLALALVGFASAATSTYVHYQLALDAGYTSLCDINESVSGTQVYPTHARESNPPLVNINIKA